jgi:hypothetical protein
MRAKRARVAAKIALQGAARSGPSTRQKCASLGMTIRNDFCSGHRKQDSANQPNPAFIFV